MGRQRQGAGEESAGDRAEKVCGSCGRRIEWRARRARDWKAMRWCSDACRARGVRPVDRALEASIRNLLGARAADATICPSEAARAVAGIGAKAATASGDSDSDSDSDSDEAWRNLMEPARRAARRLVAAGEIEITQGGRVVGPSTAKGPIRLRRARG
jgi:hypothetical protein